MDNHLVVVAAAGGMRESTCLICVDRVAGSIEYYEDVLFFAMGTGTAPADCWVLVDCTPWRWDFMCPF